MKIAVPSMDGLTLSAHFGRSRYFLVLEVEGGQVRSRDLRPNVQATPGEAGGSCAQGHGHDHAGFARLLADCDAVLSGGMGGGARTALTQAGIQVCLVDPALSPEAAALAFAAGTLEERPGSGCSCHGHHA
jgi:predicted Fe-Mo cluster-binding NifX family protein